MSIPSTTATFLVTAPDQAGLVARLSGFFYELGINIVDASNHTDLHAEGGPRFFMRLVVDLGGLDRPGAATRLDGSGDPQEPGVGLRGSDQGTTRHLVEPWDTATYSRGWPFW